MKSDVVIIILSKTLHIIIISEKQMYLINNIKKEPWNAKIYYLDDVLWILNTFYLLCLLL